MCVLSSETKVISVSVDDIKMAGKTQNMAPKWKKLTKNVDTDEPKSFLDSTWDALSGKAHQMKQSLNSTHKSRPGATEKLPGWQKPYARTVVWSYDME